MNRRRFILAGAGTLAGTMLSTRVGADEPVRILVGFSPGGTADIVARAVAEGMRAEGVPCVVENKVGASGRLAVDAALASPANGRTLVIAPSSQMTLLPFTTTSHARLLNTMVAVGSVAQCYFALAVNADSGPATLDDYLAQAKSAPGQAFYAIPGTGSQQDFLGQALARKSGVPLVAIPYKGGIAALTDVVGGVVPAALTATPNMMQMYRSKRIRLLGVSADAPVASLPGVPTFASLGYPELTSSEYICVLARRDLARDRVTSYSALFKAVLQQKAIRDILERQDYVAQFQSDVETNERMQQDTRRWRDVVKSSGFTPA